MSSQKRKKRKKPDRMIPNLLIMVALVLVIFEGPLISKMVTQRSKMKAITVNGGSVSSDQSGSQDSAIKPASDSSSDEDTTDRPASATADLDASSSFSQEATLAGLPGDTTAFSTSSDSASSDGNSGQSSASSAAHATVSNPDSPAIVPEMSTPVDDSYFTNAAFIGDSRMEGFRNASGITQGQFFTSIGMSLATMRNEAVIQTAQGNITVAAALSGRKYDKIYVMMGTNDLGEFDWPSFQDGFTSVMQRFQEIQPDATIYICSVIYVEESKVSSSQYINNANVDIINSILLEICENEGYHYLDLNEVLSNGYGSLIEGASSDGVHMYENYCKLMLKYLKTHYVEDAGTPAASDSASDTASETETETSSESE